MELRSRSSSSRKGGNLKHTKLKGVAVRPEVDSSDSGDSSLVEEEYLPTPECEDSSSADGDLVNSDYESQVKGAGRSSSKRKRVSYGKKREVTELDEANEDTNLEIELDVSEEINGTKRGKRNQKKKRKSNQQTVLMWEVWREDHERWLDANMNAHSDFGNRNEVVTRTYQAPSDLVVPLIRYQQEWLAWGLEKEESETKGGILADEMGMGKTIQAIALVLAKRELLRNMGEPTIPPPLPASSSDLSEIQCTLVICPVVAVTQWVNEIERFTAKGSTKVWVYHGANRAKTAHLFSDYDFVITTYSIVEAEYRKNVLPPKEKCKYCGKLLYPDKMALHLRYFCGPAAVRTVKQSKQARKGEKNRLKFAGTSEKSEEVKNKGQVEKNIVLAQEMCERMSILHSVKWQRIILDEAHFIKERRSSTARSILALESSYKWALSGTPLQNRIGELYSLVRFLRIVPYSYYFCKDCDCRKLDTRSTTVCPYCPHKVRHFCWWNKFVAKPIQLDTRRDEGERAMFLLKNKILKNIVLRRTKRGRAADLALPPTIISVRRDVMDAQEEDYYQSVYSDSHAQFNTYIEDGTVLNNYAHIFDLLTRLRQAVDHPYLVIYSKTAASRSGDNGFSNNGDNGFSNNEQLCGICHDPVEDTVVAACAHAFCKSCLFDFIENAVQVSCPSCLNPLTVDLTRSCSQTFIKGFKRTSILNRVRLDNFHSSTKIEALREEIRFMIERDGSAKGIVFSQFTSFLDLINYSLEKSGISCVQLVGSMSIAARNDAIAKFTDDPNCKIFLMSLKAGGVALNLTVASYVFLMDPWWNPAVEKQAQDRIHRIGQYKPIRIVRFIIKNTIEERILRLQEKKELVFEGTVGGSSDALGRLTVADMQFLFTM